MNLVSLQHFSPCVVTLVPAPFLPPIQHNPSLNVLVFYRRNRLLFLYFDCDDCSCDYLILTEYIADSVLDSVESASLSFLRLYASTSLFLTYSNVNSSSSLASRAVIRVSYSSGRPHSNNVATCRSLTSSPTPRSCSTSRNIALMYSCMLWSSCNLILYSFFLKYILLLRFRVPSEAVSTCPSHLCSCRCEQAGCLQQSEISYIDRIRCVALHYRPCVLTNQQHLYFKLPNLVV